MRGTSAIILVGLLILQGCDDLLTETPEDFLAPENFYRTAADADAAVLSIYVPLGEQPGLKARQWIATDAGSDITRVGPLEPNADIRAAGVLATDPGNIQVTHPWGQLYGAVARANVAADRIAGVEMDATRRAQLIGEARFLRALSYFYLVRLYGDVPLIVDSEEVRIAAARTPKEEVYRQIVQDAEAAAAVLPARWDARNVGRASRGAALTLLADVHLTRREWDRAAAAARQVVDLGVHRLENDYLRPFLPASKNGPEEIFSLQANGPTSPVGSNFVAMYFPREVGRSRGGGNGTLQPTQWHYDSYLPGDYRKEVTYATRWTNIDARVFNLYPHVFKYRPSQVTNIGSGDVNIPIYRYAEVLLIQAEALNEMSRTSEAIALLDQVRARARGAAGIPRAQPASYTGPATQAAVRDAIFQERNWELAHEGKRWYDLVRRGEAYFLAEIRAHDPEATGLEATDMLWPIPQTELDLNPALVQNPGY